MTETTGKDQNHRTPFEERRLQIEEGRLHLDNSFAKKWLPTLMTLMVGLIAAIFSYAQQQIAVQDTERARIEAKTKAERDWGFKVVEMYFAKRELFDMTTNPDQAETNLRVLAAVAPAVVQGVLNAELSRIPPPSSIDELQRMNSLSAVAAVQDALDSVKQEPLVDEMKFSPSDFTIYIQYPEERLSAATSAQSLLANLGFRVPAIDKVNNSPSNLQVRYYRPNQRTFAKELAAQLGKELKLQASTPDAFIVPSSKQLPSGILEVWIPSQSDP